MDKLKTDLENINFEIKDNGVLKVTRFMYATHVQQVKCVHTWQRTIKDPLVIHCDKFPDIIRIVIYNKYMSVRQITKNYVK